jgi:hypothetical protein
MSRVHVRAVLAAVLTVGAVCVAGGMPPTASAFSGFVPFRASYPPVKPVKPVSGPEAVALLNEQRATNGIPGDLVDDPALDLGCLQWASLYQEKTGQYPHEEIQTQPGYTQAGDEAAKMSDLGGGGLARGAETQPFTRGQNPWSSSPLHLAQLMDPATTTAWYGADGANACMGTSGRASFAAPAFYSYPGDGSQDVAVSERAAESPFTPAQAAGLSETTGPNFILFPEGPGAFNAEAETVTLEGPSGSIPVSIVGPRTPAPEPNMAGFPHAQTVREYSGYDVFVLPPPLMPATPYAITVVWRLQDGEQHVQLIHFRTEPSPLTLEEQEIQEIQVINPPPGGVAVRWRRPMLTLSGRGLAINHRIDVYVSRCTSKGVCHKPRGHHLFSRSVLLGTSPTTIRVPFRGPILVRIGVHPFTSGSTRVLGTVPGSEGFLFR